ncbi:hypothetical protein [Aureivirga marina]|uniref:hypothetical protein n=1 Tax=Aureivirga marina TaxID=1182451 RepID=UPI0018CB3F0D|nr:hypothetical protein [Aureivirga marina]
MISAEEREKLKKVLNRGYISEVKEILEKKGVLNSKGNPHSSTMISNVLNMDVYNNDEIELALYTVFSNRIKKQKEKEEVKRKLLNS